MSPPSETVEDGGMFCILYLLQHSFGCSFSDRNCINKKDYERGLMVRKKERMKERKKPSNQLN